MIYIAQVIVIQLLFLLFYQLILKRETFFNWNRLYLLGSMLISFILPLLRFERITTAIPQAISEEVIMLLPTVTTETSKIVYTATETVSSIDPFQIMMGIWILGSVIFGMLFVRNLTSLLQLKSNKEGKKYNGKRLVELVGADSSFSFLNTIYIGDQINETQRESILEHEYMHVKGKHSFDKLLCEILRIVLWFNPAIYIYQAKLTLLHEYIADASTTMKIGKKEYYQELLSKVFNTENVSFVNTFFNHSLIKKRILMLKKTQSTNNKRWKYTLIIPFMAMMMFFVSSQNLIAQKSKKDSNSEIIRNIEALKESIAKKGNISDEEDKELQALMLMILPNGLNNPALKGGYEVVEFPLGVIKNHPSSTVPIYMGCDVVKEELTMMCMSSKINEHFRASYDNERVKGVKMKQVEVDFRIGRDGKVSDVQALTKNASLNKEIQRIFDTLFDFEPATIEGNTVAVTTRLTIVL